MNSDSLQATQEYWQPELETMPREQLEQLQVKKLPNYTDSKFLQKE